MDLSQKLEKVSTLSERSELIRKLEPSSTHRAQKIYIPLQGTYTGQREEKPFDLSSSIAEFLVFKPDEPRDPRVLLLQGDAGSGKSVFAQQFHQQLWKEFTEGDPIPLWIPLPELVSPFHNAVEEVLERSGLSEEQIGILKSTERFYFIVDGYDELHNFQNCYETNQWSGWRAKVVITCRTQALYYQRDYEQYFTPFEGTERLSWLLTKLYVAPFNQEQISAYLSQYQALNPGQTITVDALDKVPNLRELMTSPFMLHMAVECLSEILAGPQDEKLRRVNLYDLYIERWFSREAEKVAVVNPQAASAEELKQRFWGYCKELAVEMHSRGVSVIPYQARRGGRFGNKEGASVWERFFRAETVLERSACPLRYYGENHYGFIHATLMNYFATRTMYDQSVNENPTDEKAKPAGIEKSAEKDKGEDKRESQDQENGKEKEESEETTENQKRYNHPIHRVLFTHDAESVQMLAERIQQDERYKQEMLWCIEQSKKEQSFAIAAANAITALVRAGVPFNGADLKGIRIAGANISGGYFDRADLSQSDLQGCQLNRVWLRGALMVGCQLGGVSFGEYPYFQHEDRVNSICYRPEINRLVTASGGSVFIWEIESGRCIWELRGYNSEVISVSMSDDGEKIASSCRDDQRVVVWDYLSGKATVLSEHSGEVTSVMLSADGQTVASGSVDGTVRVSEVQTDKSEVLQGHDRSVRSVHLSADGQTVASGSMDGTVRVSEVQTNKSVVLKNNGGSVRSVHLSANGQTVASGCENGSVRVWNVGNGESVLLQEYGIYVLSVYLSADGQTVASGSQDSTVRVWDMRSGQSMLFLGNERDVNCVQLSPDGRTVASGGEDQRVRVWDVQDSQDISQLEQKYHINTDVHFSGDGRALAWGCTNLTVVVRDVRSGESVVLRKACCPVTSLSLSADGRTLAAGSPDKTLCVWDLRSNEVVLLQGHEHGVESVQLSADGQTVAWCVYQTVQVRDMRSGKSVVLRGHEDRVTSVHLSADGQTVASCGDDQTVRVWDVRSGRSVVLRGHEYPVKSVQLSADGQTVASCSYNQTVRVWDVRSGGSVVLRGHEDCIRCLQLSADGRIVASGSQDQTVRVWNVKSGESVILSGHGHTVSSVQLSEDGRTVISGSIDRTVRVWDIGFQTSLCVIRFNDSVKCLSFHELSGLLSVLLLHGSVQLWKRFDERGKEWQLQWSSDHVNLSLHLDDCDFTGSGGLSSQNERLLLQRGAIDTQKVRNQSPDILDEQKPLVIEIKLTDDTENPEIPEIIDQLPDNLPDDNNDNSNSLGNGNT